jgi:hypothetical protein
MEETMKNSFENRVLIGDVLDLAKAHMNEGDMADSAQLCYKIACDVMGPAWLKNNSDIDIRGAAYHGLRSLAYSVGLDHASYKEAQEILAKAS